MVRPWAMLGLLALALVGLRVAPNVMQRVRAHARSDWLESKYLTLAPVIKGLHEPTFVTGPPDGSKRLFVLERDGLLKLAEADGQVRATPFLDLTLDVSSDEEQGLLGLAFHPQFQQNGYVYVSYTDANDALRVVRYTVRPGHMAQADLTSEQTVLVIPKRTTVHNGGMLAFGPDGDLYVSVGDDEAPDQAQALDSELGKILRLDVDSAQPYAIPRSNPFVGQEGARGEIWAYGLRNPWRFSFDRATGDLWIADVGDTRSEEIDLLPANSAGGQNFGWPMDEGNQCVDPVQCHNAALVPPVTTYGHDMNCAVIGGYVYRGVEAVALTGSYLFGDLCTGGVFAIHATPMPQRRMELAYHPIKIASFGEDAAGEVYVVDYQGGTVYRITDGSLPVPK